MITQQDIDDVAELADPIPLKTPLEMVRQFAMIMDHPLDENWKFNRDLEDLVNFLTRVMPVIALQQCSVN